MTERGIPQVSVNAYLNAHSKIAGDIVCRSGGKYSENVKGNEVWQSVERASSNEVIERIALE